MSTNEPVVPMSREEVEGHLDAVRDQLKALVGKVPDKILTQMSVKRNGNSEMMICVPDPSNPGGTLCR